MGRSRTDPHLSRFQGNYFKNIALCVQTCQETVPNGKRNLIEIAKQKKFAPKKLFLLSGFVLSDCAA